MEDQNLDNTTETNIAVTSPTTASMQVSGEYLGAGTPSTLIINLDMTKDGQVWKLNKVSCPKS